MPKRRSHIAVVRNSVIAGIVTGLIGLTALVTPPVFFLEERIGLYALFKFRGPLPAPDGVVVVAIDRATVEKLGVPEAIDEWPRDIHADLVDRLDRAGATVIVFDLMFEDDRDAARDEKLAESMRRAGNVILYESLSFKTIPLGTDHPADAGEAGIETLNPPITRLVKAARGVAPFPLPKVPIMLSQFWTFKPSAGDVPTLPVLAFHSHVVRSCFECRKVVKDWTGTTVPFDAEGPLEDSVRQLRERFVDRTGDDRDLTTGPEHDETSRRLLRSMIRLYSGPASRYLNFYGPAGSISTVSYASLFDDNEVPALAGKAVFIGLTDQTRPEVKDGFYTVFSQPDGKDISGVEVAATAFANLLQDSPIRPLRSYAYAAIIVLWGVIVGMVCRTLPIYGSVLTCLGLIGLYAAVAVNRFSVAGMWLPIVIPVLFQVPAAFIFGVLWKLRESRQERRYIRQAFGYYLPPNVVEQLTEGIGIVNDSGKLVHGTCLFTDAFQYTHLAEQMSPHDLGNYMNDYFEAVFAPIRQNRGIVLQIVGDAVLALWTSSSPSPEDRHLACRAALSVADAVHAFNRGRATLTLPTRIGLHSGQFLLGSIGAIDHYEYRPTGDIVNTASRVEGLNKYLGTEILASGDVLEDVDGLLSRKVGAFIFAGKSKPVVAFELIGTEDSVTDRQKNICRWFGNGLDAYRRQLWADAIACFQEVLRIEPGDGPSVYYKARCRHFLKTPPETDWDNGVIVLDQK